MMSKIKVKQEPSEEKEEESVDENGEKKEPSEKICIKPQKKLAEFIMKISQYVNIALKKGRGDRQNKGGSRDKKGSFLKVNSRSSLECFPISTPKNKGFWLRKCMMNKSPL